jgi:hypothetical protein
MATIEIADNDARVQYTQAVTANTTQLTIDFPFFDLDDINVIVTTAAGIDTTLSRGTGTGTFAVTGTAVDDGFSGGYITLGDTYSAGTDTFTIFRDIPVARTTDFPTSGPFNISSLNTELDKIIAIEQELETKISRTMKLSDSDTAASITLPSSATRANKFLSFDANGGVTVSTTIGDYKGTDTTTTTAAYVKHDVIKSTTTAQLDNVYICVADSAIGDLLTDTNHFELLVDAVSAATSATNAASSASAAATSASNAATSETNAATSESNAATSETNAATSETNAATSETNAATSATNAANSASAAEATFDLFDDSYLGAKASDPSLDNDGNALQDGALYFDTTNNVMKVYDLGTTTWLRLTPTVANQTNINTVAGIASDVTTVAGISSNVTTVAGISANTTTVAGISSDVTTVAGISADVTTVAGDSADIATVAGISSDVSAVGAVAANVTTVANNLTDINSFANTYFIGATAPSSPTEGDLWFDTANDIMKVYDGSGFVNAGSSVNGTAERSTYTATSGQTTFAATYDAGYVDVYLNGIKLIDGTDFTATDGANVVLTSGAALNDTVDIVGYGTFNIAIPDISGDATPQLGGNLDVNGNSIVSTSNGNINITPNGTGNVSLGNFTFDADQSVGAGQDNYLLTYDHSTTSISLEAAPAGGAGYFQGENGATGDTTNGKGDIFRVHEQELNTNTTIAAGDNAGAFFSLTVATGVTLTVNGNLVIA